MKARYAFIESNPSRFPIQRMCQVLDVARSGYYAWRRRPECARAREDRQLLTQIQQIFRQNRRVYGSPRIHQALRQQATCCGRKRVARLMRQAGLRAKQVKKFRATTQSKHAFTVAENRLDQQFQAEAANQVWASDITYIETGAGWLYLAVVIDLFSRRVVGWAMAEHLRASLTLSALEMAILQRRPEPGLLHHSDRGVQYACADYQKRLRAIRAEVSMSDKGNCYDNAPVESFFQTLKTELIYHRRYATRREAKSEIFEYIECFYNRQRLHSTLDYCSPADWEAASGFEDSQSPARYAFPQD